MKKELNLTEEILSRKAKELNIWNVSEKECEYTESDVVEVYSDFLSVFEKYLYEIFMLDTDKPNYKGVIEYLKNIINVIESDDVSVDNDTSITIFKNNQDETVDDSNDYKQFEGAFVKDPLECNNEDIIKKSNNDSIEECDDHDNFIQELIEEKMYLLYCISQIEKRGIIIENVIPGFDFTDITSFYPSIFGNDKRVIKLYEDILIKENKERILKEFLK